MRRHLLLAVVLVGLSAATLAAPRFDDYPASSAKARPGKLSLVDAKSRKYASVLRDASRRKPDFAGHFVLASWGCGASCLMSAAIDAKTGGVTWLPFTVCCWGADIEEPLEFRLASRLLIVHGSRNEKGSGDHYYTFDGRQFSEVLAQ